MLFHSPPGVLFTFPSRYLSTIGHRRVFRVGGWSPRLPTGFHVSGSTQVPPGSPLGFAYGALTLSRRPSQAVPLPRGFVTAMWVVLQPRRRRSNRRFALGPRSLATTRGISFDFSSSGYLDVSVPRVAPPPPMCSAAGRREMAPVGFAHSETHGSRGTCPSPWIIAACRVLRRLPVPRHPPCALGIFYPDAKGVVVRALPRALDAIS